MSFSNIKHIFFDYNGTLLNDTELCFEAESRLIERYNLKPVTLDFYLDNFCFPVKDYYVKMGFDFNKISYTEVSELFFEYYLKEFKEKTHLYPDVKETILELKRRGYKIYILTACEETMLVDQLKYLGIYSLFDGISAANNIKSAGKIEYGKQYLVDNNINPEEAVMVGDTFHDHEVANALNMNLIISTYGHNSKKVLDQIDTTKIDKMVDLLDILK